MPLVLEYYTLYILNLLLIFLGVENSDLYNDIAILELKEEVDVNVYTPACLASAAEEHTFHAAGKSFTLAGWGNFQHNEHRGDPNYSHIKMESPDVPHEAQVTGLECIKKVKLGNRPRPDTICIDPSTGRDGAQVHIITYFLCPIYTSGHLIYLISSNRDICQTM